jgi:hypothetical protein
MLLPGEENAILMVVDTGKKYGYGNLIAHLKREWAERLILQGVPEQAALLATNVSAYPLRVKSK